MHEQLRLRLLSHRPSAKRLILSVLSQPNLQEMSLKQLVAWGELFDHEPATVRVTAGRLTKQGLLENTDRGVYTVGPSGQALQKTASAWTVILDQVGDWSGDWLCIHTAHLGRSNKSILRERERALRLVGFEQLVTGLWCRPDNLIEPVAVSFDRLISLGLDAEAILSQMKSTAIGPMTNPASLWSPEQLGTKYSEMNALVEHSQEQLEHIDFNLAMRESFLIGEHVIRQINADPLLPDEMIDAAMRKQMVAAMRAYDAYCHPLWIQFRDRSTSGDLKP